MTKKDVLFAIITGLTTGVAVWQIFAFLGKSSFFGISLVWAILVIPILWIAGVWLGYFLGHWIRAFVQFGKFAAIGFANSAVDFGVLYILIASTGIASGGFFSLFKTVSFSCAVVHSYLWNKYWTFEAGESGGGASEFARFVGLGIVTLLVNVTIASIVVNVIGPHGGLNTSAWAGVGAAVGSAGALIFNFLGLRLLVFKPATAR